jgi:hypothetical protein
VRTFVPQSTIASARTDETVLAITRRIELANCPNQWITVSGKKYACDTTNTVGLNAEQRRQFVALVGKFNPVWSVENREPVVITIRRGSRIHPDDMIREIVRCVTAILGEERQLTTAKRAIAYDSATRERRESIAR